MANQTKEERKRKSQDATNKREMNKTWESFEHILLSDLERLDTHMYIMNQEARGFLVEQEYITSFVNAKMKELVAETVERREEYVKTRNGMKLY